MTEGTKRIVTALPETTYHLLKQAATLSGMDVKQFSAKAITDAALHTLERFKAIQENRVVLSPQGSEKLLKLMEHPEIFEEADEKLAADHPPFTTEHLSPEASERFLDMVNHPERFEKAFGRLMTLQKKYPELFPVSKN